MSYGSWITRGALATLGGITALSLIMAGCSTAKRHSATGGGSLVVGITADPATLSPWKATEFQAINVLQNLYGTLTEYDHDLNVVPGLAKSWKVSKDRQSITFSLRPSVTFSDGSAFDSADVKSSLTRIKDQRTAAVAADSLTSVSAIETPDEHTVVLRLSRPDASLPSNLASTNLAILSAQDTEQQVTTTPNGTGPFSFENRVANQSIKLRKNSRYWGSARYLDSVEFRVIPDESSIVSALQSGNVDMATFNDPLVAKTAEGGGVTVAKTPQLSYHTLQLNARRGALADRLVRLAIQCAIDRQEVVDTAALGEGRITGPITAPPFRSDPSNRPCPRRDLGKAATYLSRSGHRGLTIETIVSQGQYATSVNEAQNLKAQLAKAHITLNLKVLESGAYVDRWVAGDFDAALALNGGRPDPDSMYSRYFTSKGNLNKVAGYHSARLDDLFTQAKSAVSKRTRHQVYDQVSAELEDNAPWIWLFTSFNYTATNKSISGFRPMVNGSLQYLRSTVVSP